MRRNFKACFAALRPHAQCVSFFNGTERVAAVKCGNCRASIGCAQR